MLSNNELELSDVKKNEEGKLSYPVEVSLKVNNLLGISPEVFKVLVLGDISQYGYAEEGDFEVVYDLILSHYTESQIMELYKKYSPQYYSSLANPEAYI